MAEKKKKKKKPHRKRSAVRVSATGNVYYDYHKKRSGPKKKTGPKPKNKKVRRDINEYHVRYDYRIVRAMNNEQKAYIGKYKTMQEAQEKKKELLDQNQYVWFPQNYINNRRKSETLIDTKSEYLILERVMDDNNTSILRNEYGKLVEHNTTAAKWRIVDKFECNVEETFYVYPYNKSDRKDLKWITEHFIDDFITSPYSIVRITVYGNKVMFKYDDDFNLVICKNASDAIRMHNFIEAYYKKNKQVVPTGKIKPYSQMATEAAAMIEKKTGWKHADVIRHDTHK